MRELVIVFIHGYMGRRAQFDDIRRMLRENGVRAAMGAYRLPGHEDGVLHLAVQDAPLWKNGVNAMLNKLRRRYRRILLVGHSMGGLLAILSAIKRPAGIAGVVAVALPLALHADAETVRLRIGALLPMELHDERIDAVKRLCGVEDLSLLNSPLLLPSAAELLALIAECRRALPELGVPLTVMDSNADEIVSPRSLELVRRALPEARTVMLYNSSHFLYDEADSRLICAEVMRAAGERG